MNGGTHKNIIVRYLILVIIQILICNYFQFSSYLFLSILPVLVMCLPAHINTTVTMIIAFFMGLSVDFFSEGILGLNAAALIPVALFRTYLTGLFCGEDITVQRNGFSYRRNGVVKVSLLGLCCTSIFLIIYIWLDGASIRTFWFNLGRFAASLVCCNLISPLVINILTRDDR